VTANHARAIAVAALQDSVDPVRLKRHDALKILAHEDRDMLVDAITYYQDVTTFSEALRVIKTAPRYKILCATCGWSLDMVCPECAKGCGCETSCTGWRHPNFADDSFEGDDDPYDEGYYDEEDEEPDEADDGYDDSFEDYDRDPLGPVQEEPESEY
jgi:hypothetical protein